jgi:hypothetical protein
LSWAIIEISAFIPIPSVDSFISLRVALTNFNPWEFEIKNL